MIDYELNIGLASLYFITDPDKGICSIESPHLLLEKNILTFDNLANFLSIAWAKPPRIVFAKKPNKQEIEQLLDDLVAQKKPTVSLSVVNIPYPIFAFAKQIDSKTLNAMKVLKIRGICLITAIAFKDYPMDVVYQLEQEYRNELIYQNSDMSSLGFKPIKKLHVVSGAEKTIISIYQNCKSIIKNHPELIKKIDNVEESLIQ